jgi:hypothetical protein
MGWAPLNQARTLAVNGDLAFVACGNLGLSIIDVSNPSAPMFVIQLPVGGHVDQVATQGNRVYLTGYQIGFVIVDVTTPTAPFVIDTMPLVGESEGIALRDGFAYLLVDEAVEVHPAYPYFDALALIQLNEPQMPFMVGYFFPNDEYSSLALGEDRVFLGESEGTAEIVMARLQCPDLSDVPDSPGLDIGLSPPWPNPFNPRAHLSFNLPTGMNGQIRVFDLRGNLVADLWRGTGTGQDQSLTWNGIDSAGRVCPSGTYGFILTAGEHRISARVTGTLLR